MTTCASSGHHPDGSGVQKHSAGSNYPYVVAIFPGRVEVTEPSGLPVWETRIFDPSSRASRIEAYGRAIEAADQLAAAYRARHNRKTS